MTTEIVINFYIHKLLTWNHIVRLNRVSKIRLVVIHCKVVDLRAVLIIKIQFSSIVIQSYCHKPISATSQLFPMGTPAKYKITEREKKKSRILLFKNVQGSESMSVRFEENNSNVSPESFHIR